MRQPAQDNYDQWGVTGWVGPFGRPPNAPYAVYSNVPGDGHGISPPITELICASCIPEEKRYTFTSETRPVAIQGEQHCSICGQRLFEGTYSTTKEQTR